MRIEILDSTLRDGCQGEGISYNLNDKLNIISALRELGLSYIEAGNPAAYRGDAELFEVLRDRPLPSSNNGSGEVVAFGSTCRKDNAPDADDGLAALLAADTPTVVLFGKSSAFHVEHVLRTTQQRNLDMIRDSIAYLTQCGRRVIFDAEHFFDGYAYDSAYAIQTLHAAVDGGASTVVLCDTNGGSFPHDVARITADVVSRMRVPAGIHCHNDNDMAVAATVEAVRAGATHVQGTLLGFGERCGNVALSSVIPTLQLKLGYECVPDDALANLTHIAARVSYISNVAIPRGKPYVGRSAFAHKAGMHGDGVSKTPLSFEHIEPYRVGNERRFVLSAMAGRSVMAQKLSRILPGVSRDDAAVSRMLERVKEREYDGYTYEAAEASFELLALREIGRFTPHFTLLYYTSYVSTNQPSGMSHIATVKVAVGDRDSLMASEGNGPVNALDNALRLALYTFYPELAEVALTDYRVRVIEGNRTSESVVRVIIESSDATDTWTTIGVSADIIEASFIALTDAIEYKLHCNVWHNHMTI